MSRARKRDSTGKGETERGSVPRGNNDRLLVGAVCIILVIIVWAVFGQSLGYGFVNHDDQEYVYENPVVKSGVSLGGIQWAFTHVHAGNWHPLTTISHMLDCQLYGVEPWGHHFTNVLLHGLAAVLLLLALRELTDELWPSAIVAAFFAIHPLHVESVAWISERKDVLSGVFFMLILLAYGRYARSKQASLGRYALVVVLYAFGLVCKPTLVTVPFVLLLLDYWPLQRLGASTAISTNRRSGQHLRRRHVDPNRNENRLTLKPLGYLFVEKIPFFVLSGASCLATLFAQQGAVIALQQLTFKDRLANAGVSYVAYLGQMIWPLHLAVVYPYPRFGWSGFEMTLAFLLLAVISTGFFALRGRYPSLLVGWLWYVGMLVPMIGLVQVGMQARADRYTYLSQIGLYIGMVWSCMALVSKWQAGRQFLGILVTLIIGALAVVSYGQTASWHDSEILWKHALANTTDNYIAQTHLGEVLLNKDRVDEAAGYLREAAKISNYPTAHYTFGCALARQNNWSAAIDSFQSAIRIRPGYPEAHSNLAVGLWKLGRTDEAIAEWREALRLNNNYRDAHKNLAFVLLQLGRRDEARTHFREALRLKPDDTAVRDQLLKLEGGN